MKPEIVKRASDAKRLREDEAFATFVQEVRNEQIAVFLNPATSSEDREKAHQMVQAIHQIELRLKSAEDALRFEQQKDQHRAND